MGPTRLAKIATAAECVGIEHRVYDAFLPMLGLRCCRLRVGRSRSLSIGFGEKREHGQSNLPDTFYGEWEIGTYSGAWRFVRDGVVLCGSQDLADSIEELDERLRCARGGSKS